MPEPSGPGPVERDERDQLLERARLELDDEVGHAAPTRPGTRPRCRRAHEQLVGLARRRAGSARSSKSGRPLARTRCSASAIAVSVRRPEEVELDQADLLDAAHVVLRHHVARLRVAVERHQSRSAARLPITTPAACVDAWRVRPSSLRAVSNSFATCPSASIARAQLGRLLERLVERDAERRRGSASRCGRRRRTACPSTRPDVAHRRARLERPERDDLRDAPALVARRPSYFSAT